MSVSALAIAGAPAAFAAPSPSVPAAAPPARAARSSHASLRIDIGHKPAWVGQAIPITVSAEFRAIDGVTLEGIPQLKSDGIFTSDFARDPRQSQEVVNGEPVLVATWSGTITPSTAGPLALSVELPVDIHYRDAVPLPQPEAVAPTQDDPFADMMNIDPFDPNGIQRIFRSFNQSFAQDFGQLGRAREEAVTLKAASRSLEVRSLPLAGQPAAFFGAVGHFDVRSSLSATNLRASEPVTLTVNVQGDGDLDRVELAGIKSSSDFKAYPPTSKIDARTPGKRLGRKTFEQVLIPLHGGALTVPSVTFSAFDPVAGDYKTVETAPFQVDVEGPPASAAPPSPPTPLSALPAITTNDAPLANTLPPPPPSALAVDTRRLVLWFVPVLAILLASAVVRLWPRRDEETSLRKALRHAAKSGSAAAFFDAARRLIVLHFSRRWRVAEQDVTAEALREHLGPAADPLVSAISTADALRFGRRKLEPTELQIVCSSIEASLKEAA
ncbi:MAG TPA: BatD family protein [Polyangiaceae bacterium]|nr:BatD family protein [Polyangiaceae bacterium]